MHTKPEFFKCLKNSDPDIVIDKFNEMIVLYDFATESEIHNIESDGIIYNIAFKDHDNMNKFLNVINSYDTSYRFFKCFTIQLLHQDLKKNNIKLKIYSVDCEIGL